MEVLKLSKKSKSLYYNYIFKKKYFNNYYLFFIERINNNFNEKLYLKPFMAALLNNKHYKNLKKNISLNNILIDISKQKFFINFPLIYKNKLFKSKKLMGLFGFNFFIYKKENKKYHLSSNNYIYSNNIFYFFIFY
jgi:hypothetical protein